MSSSNTMKPPSTETLRTMDAGDVYVPADAGYGPARRARDLAVDQRLAVVVLAESAVDTARTVRFARSQGMRIVPRPPGTAPCRSSCWKGQCWIPEGCDGPFGPSRWGGTEIVYVDRVAGIGLFLLPDASLL